LEELKAEGWVKQEESSSLHWQKSIITQLAGQDTWTDKGSNGRSKDSNRHHGADNDGSRITTAKAPAGAPGAPGAAPAAGAKEAAKKEAERARQVVRFLYYYFVNNPDKLPSELSSGGEAERKVVDYIAGMTDNYALTLASELGAVTSSN
jgi:hypothetical protein